MAVKGESAEDKDFEEDKADAEDDDLANMSEGELQAKIAALEGKIRQDFDDSDVRGGTSKSSVLGAGKKRGEKAASKVSAKQLKAAASENLHPALLALKSSRRKGKEMDDD